MKFNFKAFVYIIVFFLISCSKESKVEFNEFNLFEQLDSFSNVEMQAGAVFTGVSWERACFKEGSKVYIEFIKGDLIYPIILNREKYYVEENYVHGSPIGKCILPESYLIFERGTVLYESIIKIKYYEKDDKK